MPPTIQQIADSLEDIWPDTVEVHDLDGGWGLVLDTSSRWFVHQDDVPEAVLDRLEAARDWSAFCADVPAARDAEVPAECLEVARRHLRWDEDDPIAWF